MDVPNRRVILALLLPFILVMFGMPPLWAQEKYPSREIELVIPWAPGGVSDIVGRIFANELAKGLKSPVTPINKAGGSGTIGATSALKARKDGYTAMIGSLGWLVGSILLEDIPYDPLRDFIPLANISSTPRCIFVRSDSPYRNLEDLIAKAKKSPKSISCGTGGAASDSNFALQIFQKAAGVEFTIVPFKGGGETPPAVLGGHVDVGILTLASVINFVKAGNMRALVVSGAKRLKDLPDVPTFKEKGFTQTYLDNWNGLFLPAGVPQYAIDTLASASEKAIKSKESAVVIERTTSTVDYMAGAEYRRMVENERSTIETIASEIGVKIKK